MYMKDILINAWELRMVKEGEVKGREGKTSIMS